MVLKRISVTSKIEWSPLRRKCRPSSLEMLAFLGIYRLESQDGRSPNLRYKSEDDDDQTLPASRLESLSQTSIKNIQYS